MALKRSRDNTQQCVVDSPPAKVARNNFSVLIGNVTNFQELVHIILCVASKTELTVSAGVLHFKWLSSNNSCYDAHFTCDTPDIPLDDVCKITHGPFFLDLSLFELCISTKLYPRGSFSQDSMLQLVFTPGEKVTIAMVKVGASQTLTPYLGKHKLRFIEEVPIDLVMNAMEYTHTVKFSITDLKIVLDQLRQFKFLHITFMIYADVESKTSALRISARNFQHSSKHTFFCFGQEGDEMVVGSSENSSATNSRMGSMQLKLSQRFVCAPLLRIVKAMSDHFVQFCFSTDMPLCVRYDFNSKSYMQFFLAPMEDDCDAAALANMPACPTEHAAGEGEGDGVSDFF